MRIKLYKFNRSGLNHLYQTAVFVIIHFNALRKIFKNSFITKLVLVVIAWFTVVWCRVLILNDYYFNYIKLRIIVIDYDWTFIISFDKIKIILFNKQPLNYVTRFWFFHCEIFCIILKWRVPNASNKANDINLGLFCEGSQA